MHSTDPRAFLLVCTSVQMCATLCLCGDSPERFICPHDTTRPRLQIKETLIYNAQSTYRTRLLNGETQGNRVQDEGKNTLKASQQAPAMAQEERIDSRGKRMYWTMVVCTESPSADIRQPELDSLNWATVLGDHNFLGLSPQSATLLG